MKDDNLYPSFPVYLKGAPFLLVDYLYLYVNQQEMRKMGIL